MTDAAEKDVISLLRDQHQRIRGLFDDVTGASTTEAKQVLFDELRRLLAVHETAEEMVTHPRARMAEGNAVVDSLLAEEHEAEEMVTHPRARMAEGNAVVDSLLAEEHEAKEMLADLDRMDVSDPGFDAKLATFRTAVLEHAEHEEREEFPLLRRDNDEQSLKLMAKAVRAAEAIAPTHPHPRAGESLTTNAALGPIASVVDRTRDAVRAVLG